MGGAIVVLCLLVCFLLVMTLKGAYNNETMANYHEHHMSAADILKEKLAGYSKSAEHLAKSVLVNIILIAIHKETVKLSDACDITTPC